MFVATVVEDRVYNTGGASSRRSRLLYGCSCYVHQLGYPLLVSSTVAPESLFERFAIERRLFFVVEFPWGARAIPRV